MIASRKQKVRAVAQLVTRVVAEHYRVDPADLAGPHILPRRLCEVRWLAIRITIRLTAAGGVVLGEIFGMDPTSIRYARLRLDELATRDLAVAAALPQLQNRCERALACAALERPELRDVDARRERNERVLNELCRRLNTDWDGAITELELMLFGEKRNAA